MWCDVAKWSGRRWLVVVVVMGRWRCMGSWWGTRDILDSYCSMCSEYSQKMM